MTRLHQALGLPPPDDRAEPAPALVDGARAFLLGGGTCSLEEWAHQSPGERRALALAGSDLRADLLESGALRGLQRGTQGTPSPAGWISREATEATGRARVAVKRSLLEALQARGFELPRGLESLDEQLVRLSMASLIHAVATGFPLKTAVERFERAYQLKQAAAPAVEPKPRAWRRWARAAGDAEAASAPPSPLTAPSKASAAAKALRPRARRTDEPAPDAPPGNPSQAALF